MTIGRALGLTTCIAAIAATASYSLEQVPIGEQNLIHTVAQGDCPALDWYFPVDARRNIDGYVARDQFRQIATLSGVLNPDDSYQMWATEKGGNRRESVTGRFTAEVVTLSLDGTWICGKQTFRIRPVRHLGLQGGGGYGMFGSSVREPGHHPAWSAKSAVKHRPHAVRPALRIEAVVAEQRQRHPL